MSLILVVEDESSVARTIEEWLQLEGHQVVVAGSGEAAMDWFRTTQLRPEAALLDIKLPGINGFSVADRLKGEFGFNRVIFVSAFFWEEETRQELATRAQPFFQKPLKFQAELLPFLREYLTVKE
ncbi:MAG: response regulator [Deltaproteobacteria bacterium]|nr:response regulator [Deltaproteobacteria bacterium]